MLAAPSKISHAQRHKIRDRAFRKEKLKMLREEEFLQLQGIFPSSFFCFSKARLIFFLLF
jgi:hypothetical protein